MESEDGHEYGGKSGSDATLMGYQPGETSHLGPRRSTGFRRIRLSSVFGQRLKPARAKQKTIKLTIAWRATVLRQFLHEAALCFVDIVGMASGSIAGYVSLWF